MRGGRWGGLVRRESWDLELGVEVWDCEGGDRYAID